VLATGLSVLLLMLPGTSAPTPKALPSVVGTARAGAQLTGLNGTWASTGAISYTYSWDRCDALGNGCTTIAGATRPTYLLTNADVGKTVGLIVTAKTATGSASADAGLVGPVGPAAGAIAAVGRPAVSGTAATGSTLISSGGIWTAPPVTVAYSWLRCSPIGRACEAVPGAASSTYVPGSADVGHTLVARVQVSHGSASQVVLSTPSAVVVTGSTPATTTTATPPAVTTTTAPTPATPSASTRPVVTGTVRVGQRLTAAATGATAYQWYRCDVAGAHCSSIHGAVKSTYTIVAKDSGHTLALTVQAAAGPSYASLVGPVAATNALAATGQPGLTGKPVQGQTLTVTPAAWTSTSASVTYSWERCNANGRICAPIAGAAGATYVSVAADVGHALVAVATATAAGKTQTAFSVASDSIAAPPALAATTAPAVTGTLKAGQQLTATAGVWTGTAPITYTFQWYRCDAGGAHCSSVHGATKPTYRVVAADVGKTIGLTVTATDTTGTSQPAYASLAGPIAASTATLASSSAPKVTTQGQTLTVDAGTWTSAPASTTVQWERCNANGRICVAVAGATSTSYTVTAADAAHTLVALVTAHAGSATAAAFSAAVKAP